MDNQEYVVTVSTSPRVVLVWKGMVSVSHNVYKCSSLVVTKENTAYELTENSPFSLGDNIMTVDSLFIDSSNMKTMLRARVFEINDNVRNASTCNGKRREGVAHVVVTNHVVVIDSAIDFAHITPCSENDYWVDDDGIAITSTYIPLDRARRANGRYDRIVRDATYVLFANINTLCIDGVLPCLDETIRQTFLDAYGITGRPLYARLPHERGDEHQQRTLGDLIRSGKITIPHEIDNVDSVSIRNRRVAGSDDASRVIWCHFDVITKLVNKMEEDKKYKALMFFENELAKMLAKFQMMF